MIDYEKLKVAHELSCKLNKKYRDIRIDYHFRLGCDGTCYDYCEMINDNFDGTEDLFEFDSLNDLIAKLEELIYPKPKQKYNIGDEVWLIDNFGKPITAEILDIKTGIMGVKVELAFKDGLVRYGTINEIHPAKEQLIEAQIAYWQKLKMECMLNQNKPEFEGKTKGFNDEYCEISGVKLTKKCQHESDGIIYKQFGTKYESQDCKEAWSWCVKCEEFYK